MAIYGEAEFCFASIKIVTIVGLIIFALIIDLGGPIKRDRLGSRSRDKSGAIEAYKWIGSAGHFDLFTILLNTAFSYDGVEFVAVAASLAETPRYRIPKAVRMGPCHLQSRVAGTAVDHQRRHSYHCPIIRQRLSIHQIEISVPSLVIASKFRG